MATISREQAAALPEGVGCVSLFRAPGGVRYLHPLEADDEYWWAVYDGRRAPGTSYTYELMIHHVAENWAANVRRVQGGKLPLAVARGAVRREVKRALGMSPLDRRGSYVVKGALDALRYMDPRKVEHPSAEIVYIDAPRPRTRPGSHDISSTNKDLRDQKAPWGL